MKNPDATSHPILIVDDEEQMLFTVQQTLQRAHYDCVVHSNPVVALEEIKQRKFSVIISSIDKPVYSSATLFT